MSVWPVWQILGTGGNLPVYAGISAFPLTDKSRRKKTPTFPGFGLLRVTRNGSQIENEHFCSFWDGIIQQTCAGTSVCLTDLPVLLLTPPDSNRALADALSAGRCFVTVWAVPSAHSRQVLSSWLNCTPETLCQLCYLVLFFF